MARIGIIGACGVGKAHAIAALKRGHELAWVMDTDADALKHFYTGDVLQNSWGTFKEEVPLHKHPDRWAIRPTPTVINSVDLIIVATPDHLHQFIVQDILNTGYTGKILCEKPYTCTIVNPQVYVGFQWLYKRELVNYLLHQAQPLLSRKELRLAMFHSGEPHQWNQREMPVLRDLGSHLVALALHVALGISINQEGAHKTHIILTPGHGGPMYASFDMHVSTAMLHTRSEDGSHAWYSGKSNYDFHFTMAFQPWPNMKFINGWDTGREGRALDPSEGEIFIGTRMRGFVQPWWEDAFGAQLDAVLSGTVAGTSALGYAVDRILDGAEYAISSGDQFIITL